MSCLICWNDNNVISLRCFPTHTLCVDCMRVLEKQECPLCKKSFIRAKEDAYIFLLWRVIGVYIYNVVLRILDGGRTLEYTKKNFNINIDFFIIYPIFSSLQIVYLSFIKERNSVFVAIANIIWLPISFCLFVLVLATAITIIASIEQMNVFIIASVLLSVSNNVKLFEMFLIY